MTHRPLRKNGIGEAELPDAVGDLPDVLFGMGSGIAQTRPKLATAPSCTARFSVDLCPNRNTCAAIRSL
jgi:hypothetical protein